MHQIRNDRGGMSQIKMSFVQILCVFYVRMYRMYVCFYVFGKAAYTAYSTRCRCLNRVQYSSRVVSSHSTRHAIVWWLSSTTAVRNASSPENNHFATTLFCWRYTIQRSDAATADQQHRAYHTVHARQSPVQYYSYSIFRTFDQRRCTVLLFGRTIKYCVTNIRRKFPTSLSTLSYKTPVFPTGSTLQYHKSNTPALIIIKSLNWTLPCT
jgi:hypothetical protein